MRPRVLHWVGRGPAWARAAAAAALAAGGAAGVLGALGLGPERQAELAGSVFAYAQARAGGQGDVFGPALEGWLRAAGPVWLGGLWPGAGLALVPLALGLHGFALGFGLAVAAAAGGWSGLLAGLEAVLPGNLLALPALWWLGTRALGLAASRRSALPVGYAAVGLAVLAAVAASSLGEAWLAPVLLRATGMQG
jgi:hypothetical protein